MSGEILHETRQHGFALFGRGVRGEADHACLGVGLHAFDEEEEAFSAIVVGGFVAGADEGGLCMKEDGRLDLPCVHVAVRIGDQAGAVAGALPLAALREEGHARLGEVGFLDDVRQDVVAAVRVDEHEFADALRFEGLCDVCDHEVQRPCADAHSARPGAVLVAARDRDGRKRKHRVDRGKLADDDAGDCGVGDERQVSAVLLERADRQHGDARRLFLDVNGRDGGQQAHGSPSVRLSSPS